jgi:uncharacterized protein
MAASANKLLSILKLEKTNRKKFSHIQPKIKNFISDVQSWPEIEKANHTYGGTEFRLFNRSLGHIHSNGILDLPFIKDLRKALLELQLVDIHHLKDSISWVSKQITDDKSLESAKNLMLLSYWVKGINYFEKCPSAKSFIYQKLSESNFPDSIFALAKFELKYHKIKMIEAMPITLVIGASENPSRYSNLAVKKLLDNNFPVVCFGKKAGAINDIEINTTLPKGVDVHTITLYINQDHQESMIDDLINLKPKRIIFNPGTENMKFEKIAKEQGIEVLEACTLVMMSANTYFSRVNNY